jgi:GLPGLI family protein
MKKLIILLVLSFANFQAESQNNNTFTANYEVIYRLEHSSDSTNIKDKSVEDFHLFIGDNKSKFISKNQRIRDSIVTKMEENFNGSINFANKNMPKTKFNEIIFKDYKNNKLKIVDRIGSDEFLYSEVIQPYTWEIKQDKKVINDFKVQKAVTKFGGREFIAWFTEEIAIPQGPYKFEGLPGLIVQISDTENHYNYQLISFKEVNGDKQIEDLDININYIKTSKQEFYKAKRDYYANYFVRLNEKGISLGLSPQKKRKIQEKFDKQNNPIELE